MVGMQALLYEVLMYPNRDIQPPIPLKDDLDLILNGLRASV